MNIIKTILLPIALLLGSSLFASAQNKLDTIYYLVDTTKTPVNDRMVEVGIEGPFRYYTILCACLKYNQMPVFLHDSRKQHGEILKNINKVKFIALSKLTHLAQEGDGDLFNNNHIAYFIEPYGKNYIKYKVQLKKPRKPDILYNGTGN